MTAPVDVCAIADIPNGKHKGFMVDGQAVLLFNLNGRFHAIRNRCTHLDFPLEGGRQLGWEIICRRHGARFDIRSGCALGGPAVEPVAVYETCVADGRVAIRLPATTDAAR